MCKYADKLAAIDRQITKHPDRANEILIEAVRDFDCPFLQEIFMDRCLKYVK